jgi:hypothetical protein
MIAVQEDRKTEALLYLIDLKYNISMKNLTLKKEKNLKSCAFNGLIPLYTTEFLRYKKEI